MARSDRTSEFLDAVQSSITLLPDIPRRNPQKLKDREREEASLGKEYIANAYTVLNSINKLTRMLTSIRKPYLNIDPRSGPSQYQETKLIDFSEDNSWGNVRQLSNEQRDQIDIHSRQILTRCSDNIKQMEASEKKRAEHVLSQVNRLTRLLPARLRQDASSISSDFIAAHRSSITWYLSRRLAEASQKQKEMQEERVKRELERSRTLGSGAGLEALNMTSNDALRTQYASGPRASTSSSWLGDASSSFIAATIGVPATDETYRPGPSSPVPDTVPPSDDEDDFELSSSQILQFETENANILRSVQETLDSVHQAESRLMEISALQMELVEHLTKQTELTDQLYEDAIASTSMVEKGNVQLREARRRSKDSRLFILVFFILSSLSLLFLHYY
ncbi:snare protein syntaxin 18/UFE1 [Lentinula detonsa]|uniref:Snare protein syntaxin 18/UFE1 n=1 Tax=Lentinula detonsa TaxID=2804962 RepID=A0A9W8NUZ5_9AGAR|nr:snare protein syntaxin 18/UFE1 [Lentinula detonsa]KAJ3987198.1 snare protein syntaxin 18/UFE1 [Lentinula detonsa]